MNPRLRLLIFSVVASLLAVWLGWKVAEGAYFWPMLAASVAGAAILVRLIRLPLDVIALGVVVFGYIAGNRGFAQLMPVPGLPLLPAEVVLLVAGGWWVVSLAHERRLPWTSDPLNRLILLWIILGTARLFFDVRAHGFLALRDYAMVYYAFFFFIAQRIARVEAVRRFLLGATLVASILVLPGMLLTEAFPAFFFGQLTVNGVPLIYYKGDLGGMFIGVGSLLLYFFAQGRQRYWAWPVSAVMFIFVAAGGNRAAMLGLVIATLLLVFARRWHFAAWQGAAVAVALAGAVTLAVVFNNTWAENKLHGVADRLKSLADVQGVANYESEDSFNKGDNNRYRLLWWKNVVIDTWEGNPVFGLGFGHDLAKSFAQEYNPEGSEEFGVRSPHNIFLSVFGRLGLVGLAVWSAFCAVLLRETWRSLHHDADGMLWALWCSLWVILIGASLGVVLEGPMGAVPFWTLLGLAHQPPDKDADHS